MNFLSLFVLIPLLMMLGLWIARDMKQIRTVAVIGSTILLALSVYTLVEFLAERAAGNTATMLFTDSRMWYAPLNIHYAVGVDGVSVAMLLLSSIIVFAGVFASWKINPLPHMVARWSRFGSYGSVYVACRRIDEIRRIRLFPCSHLSDASGCDRIGLDILNTYRY